MPKIFLSHSSDDKQFVEIIANKFGKDNVVYDKFSFEVGGITFNQIVEALNNSDLFVIFISNKALNSQWVRNELNIAYEYLNLGKLKQIFPIIIDENIDYTDERIPEWMKNGMTAYNLKFVESPLVAYRLINTCFKELKNKVVAPINNYVGHEKELLDFQDKFYGTDSNYVCIVASGLQGIGRTTFIKQCLLKLNIIKPSNEPIVIEFNRNQSIEDMICKIVDIGYGYENIFTLAEKSIAEKIDILLKQFSQIQQFHEFVIFKDEGGLINSQGIVSWLNTVIQKLRHELTFGIASKRQLSYNKIQDKALIYSTNITELDNGNKLNLLQRLTQLDIDSVRYFTKFLSGHPMQVKYCAQLINDLGFEETKNRADLLNEYSFKNVRNILTSTIESLCYNTDDKKSLLLGYLGFLAKYPNIPVNLVLEVNSLNPIYSEIYHNLISLCICQKIGATKDILTTSPIICDYFDRNRIDKAADIEKFLNDKFLEFQNNFNEGTIDEYYYSQVDYNLKNIIVSGVELNKDLRFCYPSIIVRSIIDLYNLKKYDKVIELCRTTQEDSQYWDQALINTFYYYYCMALAHKKDNLVMKIIDIKINGVKVLDNIQISFIKGFYYKFISKYDFALEQFINCVKRSKQFFAARRELVEVFITLEDYETALNYAKTNFEEFTENPFNIFQYFKCLIHQPNVDEELSLKLLQQLEKAETIFNSTRKFYPEAAVLYNRFVENDINKAMCFLEDNISNFDNKIYYYRTMFDLYEAMKDLNGMIQAHKNLSENIHNDSTYLPMLIRREAVLMFFQNKNYVSIKAFVQTSVIAEFAKKQIMSHIDYLNSRK